MLGPVPKVPNSGGLAWNLRMCVSINISGDTTQMLVQRQHFETPCPLTRSCLSASATAISPKGKKDKQLSHPLKRH